MVSCLKDPPAKHPDTPGRSSELKFFLLIRVPPVSSVRNTEMFVMEWKEATTTMRPFGES